MKKYKLLVLLIFFTFSCKRNVEEFPSWGFLVKDSRILDTINTIIKETKSTNKISRLTFIRVFVYQKDYLIANIKFSEITPSSWGIKNYPPSFFLEKDSCVYLFYTGLEMFLTPKKEQINAILTRYRKELNQDILPDGKYNSNFVTGEFSTYDIILKQDSLSIHKDTHDPLRPPIIDNYSGTRFNKDTISD